METLRSGATQRPLKVRHSLVGAGAHKIWGAACMAAGLLVALSAPAAMAAAGDPMSAPLPINASSSNIVSDAQGNFVVAWSGTDPLSGQFGLFAQRYNSLGIAQGVPTLITNDFNPNYPLTPAVAMNASGAFAVSWATLVANTISDVYLQQFRADGTAIGSPILVGSGTNLSSNGYTQVGISSTGDAIVGWSTGLPTSGCIFPVLNIGCLYSGQVSVLTRAYTSTGVAKGAAVFVDSYTTYQFTDGNAYFTGTWFSLAMNASGQYVLGWSRPSLGQIRSYYANGVPSSLTLNPGSGLHVTASQVWTAVGISDNGNVSAAVDFYDANGNTASLYLRRYNKTGWPLDQGQQVQGSAKLSLPGFSMNPSGDMVAAWEVTGANADGTGTIAYAQRYDASGHALGTPFSFAPADPSVNILEYPVSVASDAAGNFTLKWTAEGHYAAGDWQTFVQRYYGP
jgi:hypothetical protein